jgi:hypothetical protein
VQDREQGIIAGSSGRDPAEQRRRKLRCASERSLALLRKRPSEHGLEELADDAERKRPLELAPTGGEDA